MFGSVMYFHITAHPQFNRVMGERMYITYESVLKNHKNTPTLKKRFVDRKHHNLHNKCNATPLTFTPNERR